MDPVDQLIEQWRVELPDVLSPELELVKRILLLAGLFGDVTAAVLPEFGLTGAEFDVLATLRRTGPPYARRPADLVRALMLSSGGATNVVNRLAARGLVERRADPGDRRSTRVALTEDGAALAARAVRANSRAHARVLAAVPLDALGRAAEALRPVLGGAEGIRRPAAPPGSG